MSTKISDEFEDLCLGLDIALSQKRTHTATPEESEKRLDDAIRESLSTFGLVDLQKLRTYLLATFENENSERELEALWLSQKPNKAFFQKSGERTTPYVFIFRRVLLVLEGRIASLGRNEP